VVLVYWDCIQENPLLSITPALRVLHVMNVEEDKTVYHRQRSGVICFGAGKLLDSELKSSERVEPQRGDLKEVEYSIDFGGEP